MTQDPHVVWHEQSITKQQRIERHRHRGCVVWFTGLSGSGKSTVANIVGELGEYSTPSPPGVQTPPAIDLIDEAAAHLDSVRRAALFDELLANEGQAWLTGTDQNLFEAFGDRATWRIACPHD